jgi:hypothetical protein
MESITDKFPIHQIFGMMNGQSWKIFESRIDDIKVISSPTYRRIRMSTWEDGIGKLLLLSKKKNRKK